MSNISHSQARSSPLVIVVVPTYDRLHFLQQAVASIQAQTYPNWKLVIVDDGSTDGTKDWLLSINDKKISALFLPHCGNIAALRNAGVAATGDGEWITFLDSDDLWLPEKLALQIQAVLFTENLWAYGGWELINESGRPVAHKTCSYQPLSGWITKELLKNEAAVTIGSLMVHRKLFEQLKGFDVEPKLVLREDIELALRLSLKAKALALPQVVVRVREHVGRSTNLFENAHDRTVFLYTDFIKKCADKELKKIAKRRQAFHITEMAAKNIRQKKYYMGLLQIKTAFFKGDKLRHIFSAIRHSLNPKLNTSTC